MRHHQSFFGSCGKLTVITDLIKDHAEGICIRGTVECLHGVEKLRGGVSAPVFGGKAGVRHVFEGYEPDVTDPEFFIFGKENIGGFQRDIDISAVAAVRQCGANVRSKLQDILQGTGVITARIFVQRTLITAYKIYQVSKTVVSHGNDLLSHVRQKSSPFGDVGKKDCLIDDAIGLATEIVQGFSVVFISSGEQKRFDLRLRSGD